MKKLAVALSLLLSATFIAPNVALAAHKKKSAKGAKKAMIANKKVGDHYVCPVSSEEVADAAKAPRSEYKGKTYLFCCPKCKAPFEKSPEKYAKADVKKK